jgi:hypothetical protein
MNLRGEDYKSRCSCCAVKAKLGKVDTPYPNPQAHALFSLDEYISRPGITEKVCIGQNGLSVLFLKTSSTLFDYNAVSLHIGAMWK